MLELDVRGKSYPQLPVLVTRCLSTIRSFYSQSTTKLWIMMTWRLVLCTKSCYNLGTILIGLVTYRIVLW
jgi:hypothetical protein